MGDTEDNAELNDDEQAEEYLRLRDCEARNARLKIKGRATMPCEKNAAAGSSQALIQKHLSNKRKRARSTAPMHQIQQPRFGTAQWLDLARGKDAVCSHDEEVRRFSAYVACRPAELRARRRAIQVVQSIVSSKWLGAAVEAFGSFGGHSQHGHIFTSDVDLELLNVPEFETLNQEEEVEETVAWRVDPSPKSEEARMSYGDDFALNLFQSRTVAESHDCVRNAASQDRSKSMQDAKVKLIGKLGRELLKRSSGCESVRIISKARVPIVTFKHAETGVMVDVTVGLNPLSSPPSSAAAGSLVSLPWDGPLSPLVSVIKVFLAQNDLDKVPVGGLGSYRLYVCVASFLAAELDPTRSEDLGELLVGFFQWASTNLHKDSVITAGHGPPATFAAVSRLPRVCTTPR